MNRSIPAWGSTLSVTGSILLSAAMLPTAAHAASPCMSALPLSVIVEHGVYGYICELGLLTYTFNSSLNELVNPSAKLNFFEMSATQQRLSFTELLHSNVAYFNYSISSSATLIEAITQSLTEKYTLPPPFTNMVSTNLVLPAEPALQPLVVEVLYEPEPANSLTSLIHTIQISSKNPVPGPSAPVPAPSPSAPVPGPSAILGVGAALRFSRQLRKRIQAWRFD